LSMAALAKRGMSNPVADYDECVRATVNRILFAVEETAKQIGVPCRTHYVKDKDPAEGIVETAREKGCDLIVMSSRGRRGLSRVLIGSQASKVVTLSQVPVLVCR
jgi:nucleotide-binding universal stress UspA family protein